MAAFVIMSCQVESLDAAGLDVDGALITRVLHLTAPHLLQN